jgi:hypothetical protein
VDWPWSMTLGSAVMDAVGATGAGAAVAGGGGVGGAAAFL